MIKVVKMKNDVFLYCVYSFLYSFFYDITQPKTEGVYEIIKY